jgi:hypothetical protein
MRRLPVVDDAVTKAAVVADPPRRGAPMDQITIMAGGRGGWKALGWESSLEASNDLWF